VEEIVVEGWSFNPPPYWPRPPAGWSPSPSWQPDPAWGPIPAGWQLWVRRSYGYGRPAASATAGLMALLAIGVVGVLIPRVGDPGRVTAVLGRSGLSGPAVTVPAAAPLPPRAAGPNRLAANLSASLPPSLSSSPATVPPTPRRFTRCVTLNVVYPHGVGLPAAIDHRIGGGTPVADFGRSTSIYGANHGLDSDGDGIACEHH
jgi:hypothetical protein